MKLGTETGNVFNHLMSRQQPALPEVGSGATLLAWTDRHAATVVEAYEKGKSIYVVIREDKSIRVDDNGMSESQTYRYEADPTAVTHLFRSLNGKPFKSRTTCNRLALGYRDAYHDYSF